MKNFLLCMLSFFVSCVSLRAQALVTSVEAESGVLTGVTIAPQTDNSSGPFVTGFDADGDKVTVNVTVPEKANYKLEIRYRSVFGEKKQDVYTNGIFVGNIAFPLSA
ncbi:MAG TPA: CBM35 domain-containing protein, partial [Segetibacter sp.]